MLENGTTHESEVGKFPHTNLLLHKNGMTLEEMRPVIPMGKILVDADILNRQVWEFDTIQNSISETTGNFLPDTLIDDLGFSDLQWQLIVQQNAGAAVFLGAPGSHNGPIPLNEALGVIEVNTHINKNREVNPHNISISGVGMDTTGNIRTLACHFVQGENTGTYTLQQAHISGSDTEIPPVDYSHSTFHDISDEYHLITSAIPSKLDRIGFDETRLSAHVTQAQKDQTDNHKRALKVDLFRMNPRFGFTYYPNAGFEIDTNDFCTVRFDPKFSKANKYGMKFESEIHPWSISLPKQLVR